MQMIAAEGVGIVIYLRQEGRGIGLLDKIRAYGLQDQGHDTVDANLLLEHQVDERDYDVAAVILHSLGIRDIRLITNNDQKVEALVAAGLNVREKVVVPPHVTAYNLNYLKTKRDRLGHSIDLEQYFPADPSQQDATHANVRSLRPWITLSYAQTLDGAIASRKGEQLLISGPISRRQTHELRALHDGILVGIGTVLADDPQLNVRFTSGPSPRPIVLDGTLRTPIGARVLLGTVRPIIVCGDDAPPERVLQLERAGASVILVPRAQSGLLSLQDTLHVLYQMGLKRVMVEGGQEIIGSFLAERLVDECVITVAPRFTGGVAAVGMLLPEPCPAMENISVQVLGGDLLIRGRMRT